MERLANIEGGAWGLPPGPTRYWVSDAGRVRSDWPWKTAFLQAGENDLGYRNVVLCQNGLLKSVAVHRLVAWAFIGPCPAGLEVNHKDGNPRNNLVENLEYVTRLENVLHGMVRRGNVRQKYRSLTPTQVEDIRAWVASRGGNSYAKIGAFYGVSRQTVQSIVVGRTWRKD